MKTHRKTLTALLAAVVATTALLVPAPAEAGFDDDLVQMTHRLEDLTSELKEEFAIHYRHTRVFRHLMEDAAQIEKEVDHIDRLVHDSHASLRHIQADVEDLDDLAHHLHELVDAVEGDKRLGHVHGNTRHVHELLTAVNKVIHAMEEEIDDQMRAPARHRRHDVHHRSPAPPCHRGGFSFSFRF